MDNAILRSLIADTKDGEWGKGDPFPDSIEMAVIRGTDFEACRLGKLTAVPVRHVVRRHGERKTLRERDILIEVAGGSKGRPTGRTLFISGRLLGRLGRPATPASFSRFIRVDESKIDAGYLFWVLQHLYATEQLLAYHTQHTGVARFQWTTCADSLEIQVPDRGAQERISALLFAYDDLIENNTRRLQILEGMAQAIYQEWFVEFRYPGHENVPLVKSDLGSIPEGWDVRSASEILEINPRERVNKNELHPFINMGDLSQTDMVCFASERKAGNSGSKFRNGDTLFARITPCLENGKTGFVACLADGEVGRGSTEFVVLRGARVGPAFCYLMARSEPFRQNAIKSMSGASGRQRVRKESFDAFRMPTPPPALESRFRKIVDPMFRLVFLLAESNARLRETRDVLLPRLMSGEIDVSDLDIDVGDTAAA